MHGLRHAYAQNRYEELTGWKCPAAGGPETKALTPEQHELDHGARLTISRELGHERGAGDGGLSGQVIGDTGAKSECFSTSTIQNERFSIGMSIFRL
jgi:hypothetical protein